MTDDLRYPVGRFDPPAAWTTADIDRWRAAIADLPDELARATAGLDDRQLDTRYRDGGWTVRQVVHHVVDSHVNALCRFKLALTEVRPTIKPYAEAMWAELADGREGPIEPSLSMLGGLHSRWSRLAASLSEPDWQREFVHPEHAEPFTLGRALAMYAWHGRHHTAHIEALRRRKGWSR